MASPTGEVLIVTGPPGAGKSTIADLLVTHFSPSALVAGDTVFGFLREGAVAPWLPESAQQTTAVIEAAAAATGRLSRFLTVVYEGVLGPWFLEEFSASVDDTPVRPLESVRSPEELVEEVLAGITNGRFRYSR